MADALGCLLILVVVAVVELAFALVVAWLAVFVFAGYGYAIPFWPTVGAILLVQLLLTSVGGALRGSKS